MRDIGFRLTMMLVIAGAAVIPLAAAGHITPADYRSGGVSVPRNASIASPVAVTDGGGDRHILTELISRPTVLVCADYACLTLCGPILDFVSAALEKSRLNGNQFQLLAV